MEKIDILQVIDKIGECRSEVLEYIYSFEDWPLYWITNKEVQEQIEAYPEDFEDMMRLEVTNLYGNSCTFRIYFDNHPNDVDYIQRGCCLSTFKDSLTARIAEYRGKIKEFRKNELLEAREYHEKELEKINNELIELNDVKE